MDTKWYEDPVYIKMCDGEDWVDIPLYDRRFSINSKGVVLRKPYEHNYSRRIGGISTKVKRTRRARFIKPLRSGGYIYFTLCVGYEKRFIGQHRLMLLAFMPIVNPEKFYANHKNGIKDDNRMGNLEWVTPRENSQHAQKNGLCQRKLDFNYAEIIKRMYATEKLTQYEIANVFGVNQSTINGIIEGKYYGY